MSFREEEKNIAKAGKGKDPSPASEYPNLCKAKNCEKYNHRHPSVI